MSNDPIRIRKRGARQPLVSFPNLSEALHWKARNDLGAAFTVDDLRHPDDPMVTRDRPILMAMTMRDALLPCWRAAQLDRLLAGEIDSIPTNPALGLERETAIFGALCLIEAGAGGWQAVQGQYHDPVSHPPELATNTSHPIDHAWIAHEDGRIIDLTARIFFRLPVTMLTPQDDRMSAFLAPGPIEDVAVLTRAAQWIEDLARHVVPEIRHMGLGMCIPVSPDVNLPEP